MSTAVASQGSFIVPRPSSGVAQEAAPHSARRYQDRGFGFAEGALEFNLTQRAGDIASDVGRYELPPTPVSFAPAKRDLLLKRSFDVAAALAGIALAAPILIVLALLVKLDSRGPAFFAGERLGLNGRRFRMYKLRTMRDGADGEKAAMGHLNRSDDSRLFKIPRDPRVTRLGRAVRRWSLDELPQLYNVLNGDMSLVGPRPFFEEDLTKYEPHHFRRLDVKPGLTGLWQVSGRSEILDFEQVVRLDREYIDHWSFALDMRILCLTVPAVIKRRGAY